MGEWPEDGICFLCSHCAFNRAQLWDMYTGCTDQGRSRGELYICSMGKQTGPIKVKGTVHGVTYYKMDGEYYARQESSLDGKRVKKDPAFSETMRYAGLLGRASKLASKVYQGIPKGERKFKKYRILTGQAMQLLKKGMNEEEVVERLKA